MLTIIAVLMAFLVVRLLMQVYQSYQCPEEEELKDFFFGRMGKRPAERRRIITHLGQCQKCRDLLDDIRRGKDLEDHMVD